MAFEEEMKNSGLDKQNLNYLRRILDRKNDDYFYNSNSGTLYISDTIFEDDVELESLSHFTVNVKVTFANCYFNTNIFPFSKFTFTEELTIIDCYFIDEFEISHITCKSLFYLTGVNAPSILFVSGEFENILFTPNSVGRVEITNSTFKKFSIFNEHDRKGSIDTVQIVNLNNTSGDLSVSGIEINVLYIAGNNLSKKYEVSGVKANVINLSYFKNLGELNFYGVKSLRKDSSVFQIVGSNLGKAEFYSTDFSSFNYFTIVDSFIAECLFINCNWNRKIRGVLLFNYRSIVHKNIPIKKTEHVKIKEAYRQLKLSMSKHNDKIQETAFYSKEMNVHNSLLKWNVNTFWDKLILYFSRYTSNYGQSFGKPFFFLFLFHLILFMIAIIAGGFDKIHFTWQPNAEGFKIAFEKFFIYINPLRKLETSFSGYLIVVDLLMRVSASFLIYNILRSTRRFIG